MKPNLGCLGLFAFLLLSIGCQQEPDVLNPKTYRSTHFRFEYPGNWMITGEETTDEGHMLFIEGPDYILLALQAFPKSDPLDDFVTTPCSSTNWRAEPKIGHFAAVDFGVFRLHNWLDFNRLELVETKGFEPSTS